MIVTVHVLAALMYFVLLAPFWLFLGLRLAIHLAHLSGGTKGWLAGAERILDDDSDVPARPQPVQVRSGSYLRHGPREH